MLKPPPLPLRYFREVQLEQHSSSIYQNTASWKATTGRPLALQVVREGAGKAPQLLRNLQDIKLSPD